MIVATQGSVYAGLGGLLEVRIRVWCLVGNGGMDPHSSPYMIPKNSPPNPFPHSLLRTRQYGLRFWETPQAQSSGPRIDPSVGFRVSAFMMRAELLEGLLLKGSLSRISIRALIIRIGDLGYTMVYLYERTRLDVPLRLPQGST